MQQGRGSDPGTLTIATVLDRSAPQTDSQAFWSLYYEVHIIPFSPLTLNHRGRNCHKHHGTREGESVRLVPPSLLPQPLFGFTGARCFSPLSGPSEGALGAEQGHAQVRVQWEGFLPQVHESSFSSPRCYQKLRLMNKDCSPRGQSRHEGFGPLEPSPGCCREEGLSTLFVMYPQLGGAEQRPKPLRLDWKRVGSASL